MREAAELLAWYDTYARELPWRVSPKARLAGQMPDPYRVWLSEIMLQQTTVATVKDYFIKFIQTWPTVQHLADADDADVMAAWAGLGYYARARNLLKCARVVAREHGGVFPQTEEALLTLPGIGPYTAASLSAIAFDVPATVLDGNVERVMARLHAVTEPLPKSKEQLRELAANFTPQDRAGDYAQAVMDLGATVCRPKTPNCLLCPWQAHCEGRKLGIAQTLPRKTPKAQKPIRNGTVYIALRDDGAVLLEQRPDRGLLGGMLCWPSTEWVDGEVAPDPPAVLNWREQGGGVRHTFTHFHLELTVAVAKCAADCVPLRGVFIDKSRFDPNSLPTVMRKAWRFVASELT